MYKSQLQELAQKSGWNVPHYASTREGPSHKPLFQAFVEVNGTRYGSEPPGFGTIKAAEHNAARRALDALTGGAVPVDSSSNALTGLCKNWLQEHAQKNGLSLPIYAIQLKGQTHCPMFQATVEVAGMLYQGGVARTKKEAEIKAARTAVLAIKTQETKTDSPEDYIPLQTGKKRVRATHTAEADTEGQQPQAKVAR